jgi:hypothetical protein
MNSILLEPRRADSMSSAAADRYRELIERSRIGERPLLRIAPAFRDELEVQARWFAGEWGRDFRTVDGDEVRIVQFGVWNREAGPDFAEAAICINGGAPIRGAIELDLDVRDWERHGHAVNPAYDGVILHLFLHAGAAACFTRTAQHRSVPQVQLDPAAILAGEPTEQPLAKPGRCLAPLRDLDETDVRSVIEAAARHRLERKASLLQRMIEAHGWDEAVYQAVASALGYKQNEIRFRLLAQRFPLRVLRRDGDGIDAMIFGGAGFLSGADRREIPGEARTYLRNLWDAWWSRRAEFERVTLQPSAWKMSGQRPANHPHRRLAALARLVGRWSEFARLARHCTPADVQRFFASVSDPYWDWHYTLSSKAAPARMALIGASRGVEILVNVLFPMAMEARPDLWTEYCQLGAVLGNRRVETAATRLFGDATPRRRKFLQRAVHQQGLLQIYDDFCMQDESDCERCRFPQQLTAWVAVKA